MQHFNDHTMPCFHFSSMLGNASEGIKVRQDGLNPLFAVLWCWMNTHPAVATYRLPVRCIYGCNQRVSRASEADHCCLWSLDYRLSAAGLGDTSVWFQPVRRPGQTTNAKLCGFNGTAEAFHVWLESRNHERCRRVDDALMNRWERRVARHTSGVCQPCGRRQKINKTNKAN